jgi:hypothetical protein
MGYPILGTVAIVIVGFCATASKPFGKGTEVGDVDITLTVVWAGGGRARRWQGCIVL